MEPLNDAVLQTPPLDPRTQRLTKEFLLYLRTLRFRAATASVLTINTATAPDMNLNDTAPAAPAGGVNVEWSIDGTVSPNNVSAHLNPGDVSDTVLRDSAAVSVIGRASTSAGDPADIVASDNTVLGRQGSGALGFAQAINAQLATMDERTLKGRSQNSAGTPEDLAVFDTDTIAWDFLQPGELRVHINQLDTGWDANNVTTTKAFDADTVTLAALADVVGTLINRLVALNILGPAA